MIFALKKLFLFSVVFLGCRLSLSLSFLFFIKLDDFDCVLVCSQTLFFEFVCLVLGFNYDGCGHQ